MPLIDKLVAAKAALMDATHAVEAARPAPCLIPLALTDAPGMHLEYHAIAPDEVSVRVPCNGVSVRPEDLAKGAAWLHEVYGIGSAPTQAVRVATTASLEHPLVRRLYNLSQMIEKFPASTHQTATVTECGAIREVLIELLSARAVEQHRVANKAPTADKEQS